MQVKYTRLYGILRDPVNAYSNMWLILNNQLSHQGKEGPNKLSSSTVQSAVLSELQYKVLCYGRCLLM